MRRVTLAVVVMGLIAFACNGDGDGGEPTPEFTATQPRDPTARPVHELTGIERLDATLTVLFTDDEETIRSLFQYTQVACAAAPEGIGAPPECRSDEPEGALVDVFPQAQCEGYLSRPEELTILVGTLAQPGPVLRAVYALEADWPGGTYTAVYQGVGDDRPADWAFAVAISDEGRILGVQWGCAETYDQFVERYDSSDLIYIVDAPAGLTGIPDLDAVLNALSRHSPDALRPFVVFQGVPCITTPEGIGAPPLCRDEALGTRVAVLPVQGCEFMWVYQDESDWVLDSIASTRLYAVFEEGEAYRAALRYVPPDDDLALIVTIEERAIVGVDLGCGLNYQDTLDGVPEGDIILDPLEP